MTENSTHDTPQSSAGPEPDRKTWLGEDDFVTVFYRSVRLSYHVKNRLIDLAEVLRAVNRVLATLESELGLATGLVEIEIFQNRAEWQERHTHFNPSAEAPSWVQGDSGRIIRLVPDPDKINTPADFLLMIAHECVHHLVRGYAGDNLPAWLDEGLAICLSQPLPDEHQQLLVEAVAADAQLPLEMLSEPLTGLDRNLARLAYAQSASVVGYLMEKYSRQIIKDLLDACARGDRPETALSGHGLNYYLLEKEWARQVRG